MSLHGTIGDFGLAEIFQLIGIQRKTGVLSLENDEEQVTVKFLEGNVVEADTGSTGVEYRIGAVLVRTGKITNTQLKEALKIQARTLQRLGHVMVRHNYIDEDELIEALRVQSLQIIYRLFRWRDGRYDMQIVPDLDYDQQHVTPIASETILMEGARMIDEWPLIERRIKNDTVIFAKTEEGEALDLTVQPDSDDGSEFDNLFEDQSDPSPPSSSDDSELSSEERRVMLLVDGVMSVSEITDHSNLGDFDTQRIMCDLLTRNLLREVVADVPDLDAEAHPVRRFVEWLAVGLVALVLLSAASASLVTLRENPLTPWRLASEQATTDRLRTLASYARLKRLEGAVHVHYLDRGEVPAELAQLAEFGYVRPSDLVDPWGRPYGYALSPGGYQIFGLNGDSEASPDLSRSHRFSSAQRMVLESGLLDR